jgi:hypothetical protein
MLLHGLIPSLPYTYSPLSTRGCKRFFFASWFRAWLGNGFDQDEFLHDYPILAADTK